jgi:hypothetical protein
MELTKELKKELKDCAYTIESEIPLIITAADNIRLVGDVAMALLSELQRNIESEEFDIGKLKKMDENQQLLITASVNYADEFDMTEFSVMTAGEFKQIVKGLRAYKDEISWGFGTNEEMRYDNGKELLDCLTFRTITDVEADVVDNLFGGEFDGGAGVFENIQNVINDEDEDDDESTEYDALSCLTSYEIKQLGKLRKQGWKIEANHCDEESDTLIITDPGGNISIAEPDIINELSKYLRSK